MRKKKSTINQLKSQSDCPNHNPPPFCPTLQQVPIANGTTNPCSSSKCEVKLELAFEYLMSKDRLQWVTITSQQVRRKAQCEGEYITVNITVGTSLLKVCGFMLTNHLREMISFPDLIC